MSLASLLPSERPAYQRKEIATALSALAGASETYWNAMSLEEFFAPLGAGWSPADNVRHLTKSMRAVSRALALPRWFLRLLFGSSTTMSRSYEALVAAYYERLREGGQAGRYAPAPASASGDLEARRRQLLAYHRAAVDDLASLTLNLDSQDADRLRLPHPILGKLTLREMLMFMLYHNLHHVRVVARRRGEYQDDSTPLKS